MSSHLPAVSNSRIALHQEWSMRTSGYDEIAKVESARRGWLPFADLVTELGLDDAIRDVSTCCWLSETDWRSARRNELECLECLEVAHA